MPELNPIAAFYYNNSNLIKSDEEISLQKAVNTICLAFNQGLINRFEFEKQTNKYLDGFEKSLFVNSAGDTTYFMRLREDAFEKGFKYLKKRDNLENVESIVVDIKTLLPLFFQDGDKMKKAKVVKKLWAKNSKVKGGGYWTTRLVDDDEVPDKSKLVEKALEELENRITEEGKILYNDLFDKADEVREGETVDIAKKRFARELYDEVFEESFEEIDDSKSVYDREFVGKPTEAAHFIVQRFLKTGERIVCKNVFKVKWEGIPVKVDFTFGGYNEQVDVGEGIAKLQQKHLLDFKIYKLWKEGKFGKKDLSNITISDTSSIEFEKTKVDFKDVIELIERTCVSSNQLKEKSLDVIFHDKRTGWRCIFKVEKLDKDQRPSVIKLESFYNQSIDKNIKGTSPLDDSLLVKSSIQAQIALLCYGQLDYQHPVSDSSKAAAKEDFYDPKDIHFIFNNKILKGKELEEFENESENLLGDDALEKGKRGNIGEIREWRGRKMMKTANGWRPVKKDKKAKQVEAATDEVNSPGEAKEAYGKILDTLKKKYGETSAKVFDEAEAIFEKQYRISYKDASSWDTYRKRDQNLLNQSGHSHAKESKGKSLVRGFVQAQEEDLDKEAQEDLVNQML